MTNSVSRLICHKIVCLLIFHVWNLWKGVKSIIWKPWTVEISYLRLNMLKLMNTLPVPYTNSWQISNDSNSTDQNYIIQSWCSSTIYKHSENFAQKTINIVWLSWQKWIKIVWKFSRPMWNSSTNISQTELSVRHSLDPPFIVEFLELSKHLPIRLSVGGVAAAARLTDRPGNVERLVWTYVIGRYILLWKEQIHIWILLETSKENLKMKFFFLQKL